MDNQAARRGPQAGAPSRPSYSRHGQAAESERGPRNSGAEGGEMTTVRTQAELDAAIAAKKTDIECSGTAEFSISGSATVCASGSATVRAYSSATVWASDSAT